MSAREIRLNPPRNAQGLSDVDDPIAVLIPRPLNRKRYWLTSITILVVILLILFSALFLIREHQFALAGLEFVLLAILYLPLVWVGLALGAKRLHDRDKSAWWLLLFYFVPWLSDHFLSLSFVSITLEKSSIYGRF